MSAPIYISKRFNTQQKNNFEKILAGTDYYLVTPDTLRNEELATLAMVVDPPKTLVPKILALPQNNLQFVQVISTGIDYLPLDQLKEKNIMVANGSGLQMVSVAEHTLGNILSFTRGLARSYVQGDQISWHVPNQPVLNLNLASLLILGTGTIGQYLAKLLKEFGANLDGVNTSGHPVEPFNDTYPLSDLSTIAKNYDIIINLLPGTEATERLFDEKFFAAMNSKAAFINVGRGTSVVEKDLVAALNNEKLAAAFLDVYETEPLPSSSPLRHVKNLYLTPHIAGTSLDLTDRFFALARKNIQAVVTTGRPEKNLVDFTRGY